MSEFQPITGIERNFTIGKVEKSVDQKIRDTSKKIIDSGVLKSDGFKTEQERKTKADEIITTLGFDSYEQLVNISRGQNYTENQKNKSQEAFDILKKSISLAMNDGGDQELQTRLYTGGVRDVLPKSWKYGEDNSKYNLTNEVIGSTITNPEIRNKVRELENSNLYKRAKTEFKSGKDIKAKVIEDKVNEIMEMSIPSDKENELDLVITYLSEQAAILREEFGVKDGSADKADTAAVLGKAVEKMTEATEKMMGAVENRGKRTRMVPRMDIDGNVEGYESQYEPTYDGFVSGLQWMENRMTLRYNDYLSMSWYEGLSKTEKDRLSLAMMMSEVANGTKKAGKDLEAIMKNDEIFGFLNEHMTTLFDKDFKLVCSKMLNDLCELYVDSNGKTCLRYKESGSKIDEKVKGKLQHIHRTQDEWADWLAKHKDGGNENSVASNIDKLNAYTAWNMFFGMGDSSMADRLRSLPTWNGVINDGLRTLNPEYKSLAKWQILKSGEAKTDQDLIGFEYFSDLSKAMKRRLALERDLGHAIDGNKFFRDKILDGEVSFLSHKMFYGFMDFFNGDRDLFQGTDPSSKEKFFNKKTDEGENNSLSQLLMDYAYKKDENGNLVEVKDNERREFTFGDDQVSFMNEFRDSLEGATMAYYCLTGKIKVDPKNADSWVKDLKSKLGMVSDLKFSGVPAFTYARDPAFWRDILVSIYGEDERRISSDYIALPRIETTFDKKHKLDPEKVAYNLNLLDFITNDLQITDNDINLNELLRLLGVKIEYGEKPSNVTNKNKLFEFTERNIASDLLGERKRSMKYDSVRDIDNRNNLAFTELVNDATKLSSNDPKFLIQKRNFDKMVKSRSYKNALNIYNEMLRIINKT